MKTCENCRHSQELAGIWIKLAAEFVRCCHPEQANAVAVTARVADCSFSPIKWEPKVDEAGS